MIAVLGGVQAGAWGTPLLVADRSAQTSPSPVSESGGACSCWRKAETEVYSKVFRESGEVTLPFAYENRKVRLLPS
jgi:hypothetical protein